VCFGSMSVRQWLTIGRLTWEVLYHNLVVHLDSLFRVNVSFSIAPCSPLAQAADALFTISHGIQHPISPASIENALPILNQEFCCSCRLSWRLHTYFLEGILGSCMSREYSTACSSPIIWTSISNLQKVHPSCSSRRLPADLANGPVWQQSSPRIPCQERRECSWMKHPQSMKDANPSLLYQTHVAGIGSKVWEVIGAPMQCHGACTERQVTLP